MKRILISLGLGLALLSGHAMAASLPSLQVNGQTVPAVHQVENGTTYVALRTVAQALDQSVSVFWSDGRAVVEGPSLTLQAQPGQQWLSVNGRCLYIPGGVKLAEGRTLVPVRVLADAFGAQVSWDGQAGLVTLSSSGQVPTAGYSQDELYWLSRIISAESRGESLLGQIAVGNVVLNRVASPEFPDTIYGVIFDARWGGQFEPVRNGSVYSEPAQISIVAAKLCLEGASVVGESLYFLDPVKAGNLWTTYNRPYIATIGVHDFYG